MCLRVYTACVCVHLPSVTRNRISSLENRCMDGAITALPGRWHQMDRGSSQISRGLLINKVIGDNGAIRAVLYAWVLSVKRGYALTCSFCHSVIVLVVWLGGFEEKTKCSRSQCYIFQHQIAPVKHSKQAERIKQEGQFRIYWITLLICLTCFFFYSWFHVILLYLFSYLVLSQLLPRVSRHRNSVLWSRLKELWLFNHFTWLSMMAASYVTGIKHLSVDFILNWVWGEAR